MNLGQKILILRKRKGLSQEDLAEILNVTRQSVSKWETGEATPEVSKLVGLAKVFDVSTDWLLSEDDFISLNQSQPQTSGKQMSEVEQIPGVIERLASRYGWLFGIYIAVVGGVMFFFGLVTNAMGSGFGSNQVGVDTEFGTIYVDDPFNTVPRNPFSGISRLFIGLGLIVIIFGLGFAYYLKQKAKNQNNI